VDSFLANPYANLKERQQQEVVQLLDKLQPDTIVLDPDAIGKVGVCGRRGGVAARSGDGTARRWVVMEREMVWKHDWLSMAT
jgi:hypothetical protein